MLLLLTTATWALSACPDSPHAKHFGQCRCTCTVVDVGLNNGRSFMLWLPTVLSGKGERQSSHRSAQGLKSGTSPRWMLPQDAPRRPQLDACITSKETCYYGFEGNPKFDDNLANTVRLMQRRHGLDRVKIFNSTVLSIADGRQEFFLDRDSDATGSSLSGEKALSERIPGRARSWRFNGAAQISATYNRQEVEAVGALGFFRGVRAHSETVVVKIDIEGFEYRLLQSLLVTDPRALCSLDLLALEWHEMFMVDKSTTQCGALLPVNTTQALEWLLSADECGVNLLNLWRAPVKAGR